MIAIWAFDDGHIKIKDRSYNLATNCFTFEECETLVRKLLEFNIFAYVIKSSNQNKLQPNIRIKSKSFLDFVNLIAPYCPHECIDYKVNLSNYIIPRDNKGETCIASKLTENNVLEVFRLAKEENKTYSEISEIFGVSIGAIRAILIGKSWKSLEETPIASKGISRNNSSGCRGVYFKSREKKWQAEIQINLKRINLGMYESKEEAIKARMEANIKYKISSKPSLPYSRSSHPIVDINVN